jgi:hypothetical protein
MPWKRSETVRDRRRSPENCDPVATRVREMFTRVLGSGDCRGHVGIAEPSEQHREQQGARNRRSDSDCVRTSAVGCRHVRPDQAVIKRDAMSRRQESVLPRRREVDQAALHELAPATCTMADAPPAGPAGPELASYPCVGCAANCFMNASCRCFISSGVRSSLCVAIVHTYPCGSVKVPARSPQN